VDQLRADRVARNEAAVRATNETLERGISGIPLEAGELVAFVCECGNTGCRQLVKVGLDLYERVRRDSRHFLILPGHEMGDAEGLIEVRDAYAVVHKRQRTRENVEDTDPRNPQPG